MGERPAFMASLNWRCFSGTETLAGQQAKLQGPGCPPMDSTAVSGSPRDRCWPALPTGGLGHIPTDNKAGHRVLPCGQHQSLGLLESTVSNGTLEGPGGKLLPEPPLEARNRLKRERCHLSLKVVGCLP